MQFNQLGDQSQNKHPEHLISFPCLVLDRHCKAIQKSSVYYACVRLQWSNTFYAEFIAPPKTSIDYKKTHSFRLSMNRKFMVKRAGTPPASEVDPTVRGDRTRIAFLEIRLPFCLFST